MISSLLIVSSLKLLLSPQNVSPGRKVIVSCFHPEPLKEVKVYFPNGISYSWPIQIAHLVDPLLCLPSEKRFRDLTHCGNSSGIQLRVRPTSDFEGIFSCRATVVSVPPRKCSVQNFVTSQLHRRLSIMRRSGKMRIKSAKYVCVAL